MLFLCLLAGVLGSSGWMVFWAIVGMLFSSRSFVWFVVPLLAALNGNTGLAMGAIVVSWILLAVFGIAKAANEAEWREKNEQILLRLGRNRFPAPQD
jgi:hypothetical protein